MELKDLKKIGLTDGEIKVYEALLELGECTKTSLAKKARVAPSNIYDITNRLIEKGIISKVEKNKVAHFSPANPRYILNFIDQKDKELDKQRNLAVDILPLLLEKFQKTELSVNIEVFEGWEGMKTIFEDMLNECQSGDKNYIFGASVGELEKKSDLFFLKYSRERERKGILTKILFNEQVKKRTQRINFFIKSKNYKVRFLEQNTPSEIMLYKNKTNIIILTKKPLVIRIKSEEVNSSFKQYFDIMWKQAKN